MHKCRFVDSKECDFTLSLYGFQNFIVPLKTPSQPSVTGYCSMFSFTSQLASYRIVANGHRKLCNFVASYLPVVLIIHISYSQLSTAALVACIPSCIDHKMLRSNYMVVMYIHSYMASHLFEQLMLDLCAYACTITHPLGHSLACSLAHSLTHTYTHIHTYTHAHSHTYTPTQTHTMHMHIY